MMEMKDSEANNELTESELARSKLKRSRLLGYSLYIWNVERAFRELN